MKKAVLIFSFLAVFFLSKGQVGDFSDLYTEGTNTFSGLTGTGNRFSYLSASGVMFRSLILANYGDTIDIMGDFILSSYTGSDSSLMYIDPIGNVFRSTSFSFRNDTLDADGSVQISSLGDNDSSFVFLSPDGTIYRNNYWDISADTATNTGISRFSLLSGTGENVAYLDENGILFRTSIDTASLVLITRTLTITGTATEVEVSGGTQDLSVNRTWTVGLPDDVDIDGDLTIAGGTVSGAPSGGNQGNGSINAESIFVNGIAVGLTGPGGGGNLYRIGTPALGEFAVWFNDSTLLAVTSLTGIDTTETNILIADSATVNYSDLNIVISDSVTINYGDFIYTDTDTLIVNDYANLNVVVMDSLIVNYIDVVYTDTDTLIVNDYANLNVVVIDSATINYSNLNDIAIDSADVNILEVDSLIANYIDADELLVTDTSNLNVVIVDSLIINYGYSIESLIDSLYVQYGQIDTLTTDTLYVDGNMSADTAYFSSILVGYDTVPSYPIHGFSESTSTLNPIIGLTASPISSGPDPQTAYTYTIGVSNSNDNFGFHITDEDDRDFLTNFAATGLTIGGSYDLSSSYSTISRFTGKWGASGNTPVAIIDIKTAGSTTPRDDGQIWFHTRPTGGPMLLRGYIGDQGGLVWGTPTDDDLGSGTINAEAVYDDNSLLSDHVFENEYLGYSIDSIKFSRNSIIEELEYVKKNLHLSTMPGREAWSKRKYAIGELVTDLWETIEVQFLYISELEKRISEIESKLSKQ